MKTYAALWAVGLALVVIGFLWDDANWLTFVGFALGAVGFFLFAMKAQTTRKAPGRFDT